MLVSHKHKLVIFTLERTASQSIHSSLEHLFDVSLDGKRYRHLNAIDFDQIVVPFIGKNYYKIAIVRDPIQRCISYYNRSTLRKFKPEKIDTWWMEEKTGQKMSQYNLLSVNSKIYPDRLFDFNYLNLFCNFLESIFNKQIKLLWLNQVARETILVPETLQDMQCFLFKDIELYKSIVDAGGELIINPYRSTP